MTPHGLDETWLETLREREDRMLWDVVVTHVHASDWDRALSALRRASESDTAIEIVEDIDGSAADAFGVDGTGLDDGVQRRVLVKLAGEAEAHAHFFAVDEIEFDVDPRELSARSGAALLRLMKILAISTSRPCLLTPENVHHRPMVAFDPTSGMFSMFETPARS